VRHLRQMAATKATVLIIPRHAQRNAFRRRDVASAIQIVRPLESKAELWFTPSSGRINPSVRSVVKLFLVFLAESFEARIVPELIEHRIEPEQRWSERQVSCN